jgi:AraC-like DNA-binding protein
MFGYYYSFIYIYLKKTDKMPIYMDRHNLSGVTAKDVAEAHQKDLTIQEDFGCRGLTYWFDEVRGIAFCLIEAPDESAVKEMHDSAHGLIPHQITEVDGNVVSAFLGRIEDPDKSKMKEISEIPIIREPAFRTIMATTLMDSALWISNYGEEQANKLMNIHNVLVHKAVKWNYGRIAKQTVDGFIVSFLSISKSVSCALEIQESFNNYNNTNPNGEMYVRIGLSAGSPITKSGDFFEQTVNLAKRLSNIAVKDQILISSVVRDLLMEDGLNSLSKNDSIKALSLTEEQFLDQLLDTTETIWNEEGFDVGGFGKKIGLSRSQLYRKLTSLTGYSPNDFIKEFRLNRAVKMIEKQHGNVSEIAFQSGFSNPSYFSKCFQKRFGILPSEFAKTFS